MADTPTPVVTSKKFSLNAGDFLKGLLVAALTTPLTTLYTSLNAGTLTIDWKMLGIAAAAGGLSYLLKNFFTSSVTQSPTNPMSK